MSFGLLEHFSAIENPIAEQMRVLRPGGLFLADIVTARFSVDSIGRFPALIKKNTLNILHRNHHNPEENKFFENKVPLKLYVATVEKSGGHIIHALGNRPFTAPGCFPMLSAAMLALYKSATAQAVWRNFDLSNSAISKWWGAGWWVIAEKI